MVDITVKDKILIVTNSKRLGMEKKTLLVHSVKLLNTTLSLHNQHSTDPITCGIHWKDSQVHLNAPGFGGKKKVLGYQIRSRLLQSPQ